MAVQNVALGKGVWISQQKVRDATVDGGGHDHEILATNIALALKTLKLEFEGFDYKEQPVPQADAYRGWIKRQLAAGHGIAWMIMLEVSGGRHGSGRSPRKWELYGRSYESRRDLMRAAPCACRRAAATRSTRGCPTATTRTSSRFSGCSRTTRSVRTAG